MRRLWKRHVSGDDGLSLIETVAALMVFALVMTGLAAGMVLFARTQTLTKARNAASTMAQQLMESAKSIPVNQLTVCTGGGADGGKYNYQSTQFDILTGTTPCLPYTSTRTSGGINFTVTQVVFNYRAAVVVNDQPITDRMLVVSVAWTQPASGSYTTHTVMSGNNNPAAQAVVGLRININDSTNTNLITAADYVWDYTVSNNTGTVASGTTDDGTSGLLSLSPGVYTCSVNPEEDAGGSYDPNASFVYSPAVNIDSSTETLSGSCTVPSNGILDWGTAWQEVTDCVTTGSNSLSVQISVTDGAVNPSPVGGAAVQLFKSDGTSFGSVNSDATTGVSTFKTGVGPGAVPPGLYTYSVTKAGYTPSQVFGPVCVASAVDNTFPATIKVLSTCQVSKSKGSLTVTVRDENSNTVAGAKVVLTNQDGQGSPASINSNPQGVAFFNNNVLGGNYTYTVTKAGYTNLGPQGPICVATNPNNVLDPATLPTPNANPCPTGAKATWVVSVVDSSGAGISGVKIHLTNANGHSGTPGDKTTDSTGTVTFTNVPTDLYLITPTVPAGYADPGVQPPTCVQNTTPAQTTQVIATGVMTVKVGVTNSTTQPTKTYNVILTDSAGVTTTNTITINKGKTGTVTFTSMPTDVYTISVCVKIATSGNCNPINKNTDTYNFTAKGTTYQNPYPPTFPDTTPANG